MGDSGLYIKTIALLFLVFAVSYSSDEYQEHMFDQVT